MEFCMACRNYQTMHLIVDTAIPRRLLATADAPPPHPKRLSMPDAGATAKSAPGDVEHADRSGIEETHSRNDGRGLPRVWRCR
ncbi:unnamed protein product [Ectocarpus fasciculatus]